MNETYARPAGVKVLSAQASGLAFVVPIARASHHRFVVSGDRSVRSVERPRAALRASTVVTLPIVPARASRAVKLRGWSVGARLGLHHVDPSQTSFTIRNGEMRSLERMRREAGKCVLLCANCHAQVEAGAADVPVRSNADGACPG